MPFHDRWVALNNQLALDHTARGSLLPEDPAQHKVFMDEAGAKMVKSAPEAALHHPCRRGGDQR
jgi:hypothetical protein